MSNILTPGLMPDSLTGIQAAFNAGDASSKAAFQAAVSGGGVGIAGAGRTFGALGTATTAGVSIINQIPCEAIPVAVQPIYLNWGATTYAVTAAKIAAVPTHLHNGLGVPVVTVTFVDVGTNVVPVAKGGTGNNIVPGMLPGDVIPIVGVARTDTPANKPLVQHRIYSADAQSAISGADFTAYNAASGGRQWAHKAPTAGDLVTVWAANAPNESSAGWVQPAVLRLYYNVPTVTIAVCGDSLQRGQGSTANSLGWVQRVCNSLTTAAKVVQPMIMAWSGQIHTASYRIAKECIKNIKPARIVIAAWSPNGGPTQAAFDTSWAETLEVIEFGRQNGVIVDVVTSGPVNSYSAAEDARIKAQNARVRALTRIPGIVIDAASVIENPANPAQIRPEHDVDGTHYTNAGYAAIAALAEVAYAKLGY